MMTASLPCSVLKMSALSSSSQQAVGDKSKSHRKTTLPCSRMKSYLTKFLTWLHLTFVALKLLLSGLKWLHGEIT